MAFFKGAAKEAQRAIQLKNQREKEHQEVENAKKRLEAELRVGNIDSKFTVHYDAVETRLKSDIIGLVTLDQMKAKQQAVISAREQELASLKSSSRKEEKRAKKRREQMKGALSFNFNDDDEEEEEGEDAKEDSGPQNDLQNKTDSSGEVDNNDKDDNKSDETFTEEVPKKRKRLGKNPDVDTSFLPDVDREADENRLREELRREWVSKQESLKEEEIEITYSYWDGSGHRRQVRMKKGHTIGQFLHKCLEQLRKEFPELKTASHDQLMYVKEDLIIPQHYSFYDFIVTKARGKSGPLFMFDARDDIRLLHDASVEKEESHAGKVCLRSWYERHKHIFPASRWEPYDPTKNWDQYSISDKMAAKITVK